MEKQTLLSDTIDIAATKIKIDECAKKIVSQKIILAWILINCLDEFRSLPIEYIMNNCIEGTPDVSNIAVHQDTSGYIEHTVTDNSTYADVGKTNNTSNTDNMGN